MIQKVSLLGVNYFRNTEKKPAKYTTNSLKEVPQPEVEELRGVPFSYISFKGTEKVSNFIFDQEANLLLESAKDIATRYNHAEIMSYHILQAALEENEKKYIEYIANPESFEETTISALHFLVNSIVNKDILSTEEEADFFLEESNYLKEENLKKLETLPKKTDESQELKLSTEIKNNLADLNLSEVGAYMLLGTVFNTITSNGILYPSNYLETFQSLGLYRNNDEIIESYLEVFDKKAIEAWNKLALGSSMFVISKNEEDKNRMISSMVKTLPEPKHGNFTEDNTLIFSISPDAAPKALIKELEALESTYPDKKILCMMDMDALISQSIEEKNNVLTYSSELLEIAALPKNNLKFIFLQNDDSYYQFMSSDDIKKIFAKYLTYYIPPVQSYEVNDIISKNKNLLKTINKPFKKDALEKAIVLAEKIEGAFPDKAIDLMKRISEYYGDEVKIITVKNIEEFSHIAGDLFKNDTEETPITYNTGKTLDSYYGKETTKKDIENIVKQIKTGKLGTQGLIITSKDEEAGAGKKYTAEVIAGEAKVPFLELDSSDFAISEYDPLTKTKTSPVDYMTKVFNDIKLAAKQNPYKTAIIYINNFEEFAFLSSQIPGYNQAKTQLAREMKKAISEDINILVIGSAHQENVPYIPVVIKDFSQNIVVDSPAFNKVSRREVLENIIEKQKLPLSYRNKEEKIKLINKLVKITEYFSYVEIKNLINKTSQIMLERNKKRASIGEFIEAYLQLVTGRTSSSDMPQYNKEATTSHECGHATNLEVMNNIYHAKGKPWFHSREVNFITLDPRGSFLGAVFEGKSENYDYPFEAMFADIVCAYGGHSCEKEFFDMDGSAGISQDLAQATNAARKGVEYFGLGYNTGKISNTSNMLSTKLKENIYKDVEVILTNAQIVSDLITETYKDFNIWFTQKYSKLIGSNNCMIDGDDFRKSLANWIASQSDVVKEELKIVEDIILDIIKSTKNGKIYCHTKKLVK